MATLIILIVLDFSWASLMLRSILDPRLFPRVSLNVHLRLHVRPILQMTGTGFFYLFFYMIPWNFEAFQAIWHIQLGSGSHLTLFISGQKLPVSQKGENWKNEIREIKGVRIVRIFSYFFWMITIIVPIDSKNKIWTFLLKLGILEFFPFYQAWPI